MRLSSPAFGDGDAIPSKYTTDGCNSSPPIRWHDVPANAAELVLMLEDADGARDEPRVHWLVYKIPADSAGLPAGVPPNDQLTTPPGSFQGRSDLSARGVGYHGPAPRGDGARHYRFRLYAVDEPLSVGPGEPRPALLHAMKGHIVAETTFTARCERP